MLTGSHTHANKALKSQPDTFNAHSDLQMWDNWICVPGPSMFLHGDAHSWCLPATCRSSSHHWHCLKKLGWRWVAGVDRQTRWAKIRGKTDPHKTLWNDHLNGGLTLAGWDVTDERTWDSEFLSMSCFSQARTVQGQLLSPPHDSSGVTLDFSRLGLSGIVAEWAWRAEPASPVSSSRACFHLVFYQREKWLPLTLKVRRDSCAFVKSVWTLNSELLQADATKTIRWTLCLDRDGSEKKAKQNKTLSYLCVK